MSCKLLYAILFAGALYTSASAQTPGSLDPTFGDEGIKILPIGTANAFGRAMVIQPDGKAVVACVSNNGTDTDFAITRFTTEGDTDFSFDDDGIAMTDFGGKTDIAEAIALDQHDQIIVAGSVDTGDGFAFAVARYGSDGTLDESFGDSGLVTRMLGITGFCKSVAIQADNKIVLGGYVLNEASQTNEFALMRYHTDGTPDSTFNGDGIVLINMGIGAGVANAIAIQPDGKIVLAGQVLNESTFHWEIGIVRYNTDGSPDETWDEDGIVFTGSQDADFTIKSVALQSDHKILVGGFFGTAPSNNLFAVARYHTDGKLDENFGVDGIQLGSYGAQDNQVNEIVIQSDGQILIAGTSLQGNRDLFAIARLDPNGTFDDTFGEQGVVRPVIEQNDGINAMALQQDGKLVVAGESFNGQRFSIAVARVETGLTTSSEDPRQQVVNASVYPNPVSDRMHISYKLYDPATLRIILADPLGRIVYELSGIEMMVPGEYERTFVLPVHLQNGIYTVALTGSKNVQGVRVVLNR